MKGAFVFIGKPCRYDNFYQVYMCKIITWMASIVGINFIDNENAFWQVLTIKLVIDWNTIIRTFDKLVENTVNN